MKSLNILVVDDDEANAASLAELFAMDNHHVVLAHNGQKAIEAYDRHDFDIGFFDVMMPVMNGVDSFLNIKTKHPAAQIYFMTGYSADDLLQTALDNGAKGVFGKPVDVPLLLQTVAMAA